MKKLLVSGFILWLMAICIMVHPAEGCDAQPSTVPTSLDTAVSETEQPASPGLYRQHVPDEWKKQINEQMDKQLAAFKEKNPLEPEVAQEVRNIIAEWIPRYAEVNKQRRERLLQIGIPAITPIAEFMKSPDDTMRLKTTDLLFWFIRPKEQFTKEYKEQMEPLLILLFRRASLDRNVEVRRQAITNLDAIGFRQKPVPEGVRTALEEAQLNDPDCLVRMQAYDARQALGLAPRSPEYGIR